MDDTHPGRGGWCNGASVLPREGRLGALIGLESQGCHRPMITPTYCKFKMRVGHDRRDSFFTNTHGCCFCCGTEIASASGPGKKAPSMLERVNLRISTPAAGLRWLVLAYLENETRGNIELGTCCRSTAIHTTWDI
jgi:hypothetical protein